MVNEVRIGEEVQISKEALKSILKRYLDFQYRARAGVTITEGSDDENVWKELGAALMVMSITERISQRDRNGALQRIEDDTYGICNGCNAEMLLHRLLAVPFAINCILCQEKLEAPSLVVPSPKETITNKQLMNPNEIRRPSWPPVNNARLTKVVTIIPGLRQDPRPGTR